jgi:hypothetical protein
MHLRGKNIAYLVPVQTRFYTQLFVTLTSHPIGSGLCMKPFLSLDYAWGFDFPRSTNEIYCEKDGEQAACGWRR